MEEIIESEVKLMETIVSAENMYKALNRVEGNKGAPGIDGVTVKQLREQISSEWTEIKPKLLEGRYKPKPVRRVEIPKPNGGVRQLGIPTVMDRLIQQAVHQILSPIFEKDFSDNSYGFREGRGAHDAVRQAKKYINEGYKYVVDIDIEKFFDHVNHDILMNRVSRKVKDKRVLRLIGDYLRSGVMINGIWERSEEGTPQGGPLSPLLSNILLDDLDKELENRGHKFCRYADDCNIYVKTERAGERVKESITKFLKKKLKLNVNEKKSAVDKPVNRKFLGFSFTAWRYVKIRISVESIKRLKDKIRKLTNPSNGIPIEIKIKQLNQYLQGWIGYYGLAETPTVMKNLDYWIRRRIRSCILQQWKKSKTRLRKLRGLNLNRDMAAIIAYSSKGDWKLSRTPSLHMALNNNYLRNIGYKDLLTMYNQQHSI